MFEDLNKSGNQDSPDNPEAAASGKARTANKTNLISDFFGKIDKSPRPVSEISDRNKLDFYAAIIPTLTLFEPPTQGFGAEKKDPQLLDTLSKIKLFNFATKTTQSADGSCWEFPAVSPPGLYGKPGKTYDRRNATTPNEEHREIRACQPEKRPPQSRNYTTNVLRYEGEVLDRNQTALYKFIADDYYNLKNDTLLGRRALYDRDSNGKGPNFKFQGLPAEAETQGVGKNVHRIDITRDRGGDSFTVDLTSYPEERTHPTTGQVGWVPIRTKIIVSTADGTIIDQTDNNGNKVKFTQTTYDDQQTNDWRYGKPWAPPYTNIWWRGPK